jgi:hypothetical protein
MIILFDEALEQVTASLRGNGVPDRGQNLSVTNAKSADIIASFKASTPVTWDSGQ